MRRAVAHALLLLIVLWACAPSSVAQAPPSEEEVLARIAADALLADSVRAELAAQLQTIADSASDPAIAAPTLLRLGWLKLRLYPGEVSPEVAAAHPADFFYNEIGGAHLYNGREFRTLLERHRNTSYADDALYAETLLNMGGECEGFTECYLSAITHRPMLLLREFPTTRHARVVLDSVDAAIAQFLRLSQDNELLTASDLTRRTEYHDPDTVRVRVADWEEVLLGVPASASAPSLLVVADLWERLREPGRARALYARLEREPGPVPRDTIRARLSRLP